MRVDPSDFIKVGEFVLNTANITAIQVAPDNSLKVWFVGGGDQKLTPDEGLLFLRQLRYAEPD